LARSPDNVLDFPVGDSSIAAAPNITSKQQHSERAVTMYIPNQFQIVCLWCGLGLLATALAVALGFDPEVGQLLALAG